MEIRIEAGAVGPKVVVSCEGLRMETEDLDKVQVSFEGGGSMTLAEILRDCATVDSMRAATRFFRSMECGEKPA